MTLTTGSNEATAIEVEEVVRTWVGAMGFSLSFKKILVLRSSSTIVSTFVLAYTGVSCDQHGCRRVWWRLGLNPPCTTRSSPYGGDIPMQVEAGRSSPSIPAIM